MNVETALFSLLTGDAGVGALVSTQVYPLILPQGHTLPAITYQAVSGAEGYTQAGGDGLHDYRQQFDLYAATFLEAASLRDAVDALMSGHRGAIGATGFFLQGAFKLFERDNYGDPLAASGPRYYRKTLDYQLWFRTG